MKIIIDNYELEVHPQDVAAARKIIDHFFLDMKQLCTEKNAQVLYYTTIIMAHIISKELIEAYTPELLSLLMNSFAEGKLVMPKKSTPVKVYPRRVKQTNNQITE